MGCCTSKCKEHRREGINDAAAGHQGADALPLQELPPAAEVEANDVGVAADGTRDVGGTGQHSRDQESSSPCQSGAVMEEPKPSTSRPQVEIAISPQPAPNRVKTSSSKVRDHTKMYDFEGQSKCTWTPPIMSGKNTVKNTVEQEMSVCMKY